MNVTKKLTDSERGEPTIAELQARIAELEAERHNDEQERSERTIVRERTPRIVGCAKGTQPKDASKHTVWVRDSARNVQDQKRKGYRMAKRDDLDLWELGEETVEKYIQWGDLVLMIGDRENVESALTKRMSDLQAQGKAADRRANLEAGAETDPRDGRTVGGRFYSTS